MQNFAIRDKKTAVIKIAHTVSKESDAVCISECHLHLCNGVIEDRQRQRYVIFVAVAILHTKVKPLLLHTLTTLSRASAIRSLSCQISRCLLGAAATVPSVTDNKQWKCAKLQNRASMVKNRMFQPVP